MENTKLPVTFRLIGIKIEQFAIVETNFTDGLQVNLTTGIEIKIEPPQKRMGAFMAFQITQEERFILKLEVSCHFQISEKSWDELRTDKRITFQNDFIVHLVMITLGTSRGILFSKTENTLLAKFILPTMDVTKLYGPEDITIELD